MRIRVTREVPPQRPPTWKLLYSCTLCLINCMFFFSSSEISTPCSSTGTEYPTFVAGAGVLFWYQVHAGRLGHFGLGALDSPFGGFHLFTAGECGQCCCWAPLTGWWWGWSPAHCFDGLSLSLQVRGDLNCSDVHVGRLA